MLHWPTFKFPGYFLSIILNFLVSHPGFKKKIFQVFCNAVLKCQLYSLTVPALLLFLSIMSVFSVTTTKYTRLGDGKKLV